MDNADIRLDFGSRFECKFWTTVRALVEHVFAHQKAGMGLFMRNIGIGHGTVKFGMANLVYNLRRYVWDEGRSASA